MSTPTAVAVPPYIPDLRAPSDLFNNVVNIGVNKAKLSPLKTFLLGIKSGCHISFGMIDVVRDNERISMKDDKI